MSTLKIGQLPYRTPVKLSIALEPELQADLQLCAQVYGEKATVAELIPSMQRAFLATDSEF